MDSDTQQGFSLEYPHISLHAIARDEQVHPRQCLYIMVDAKVDLPGIITSFFTAIDLIIDKFNIMNVLVYLICADMPLALSSENASENEDDDADTPITEMQFAPDNTNNLELMFQAMNACQALHPDPQDSFSDGKQSNKIMNLFLITI